MKRKNSTPQPVNFNQQIKKYVIRNGILHLPLFVPPPQHAEELPWYEPYPFRPCELPALTPQSRFRSQSDCLGKHLEAWIPTGAHNLPKSDHPIESYAPARRYYPRRANHPFNPTLSEPYSPARRYCPREAYYSPKYRPRIYLGDPKFYCRIPRYSFHGIRPYFFRTSDPSDVNSEYYGREENHEQDEEDADKGGSIHTVIECLEPWDRSGVRRRWWR